MYFLCFFLAAFAMFIALSDIKKTYPDVTVPYFEADNIDIWIFCSKLSSKGNLYVKAPDGKSLDYFYFT